MNLFKSTFKIATLGIFFAGSTLASVSASAQSITIPERFDVQSLLAPDASDRMRACVNSDSATKHIESARKGTLEVGSIYSFSRPEAFATLVSTNEYWACVRMSPQGFPILPVEALRDTVVTSGAAAGDLREFRRKLLVELSINGLARGLILYGVGANAGNAYVVYYTLAKGRPAQIDYDAKMLKAGEFSVADYTIVLNSPAIRSIAVTQWGSGGQTSKTKQVISAIALRPASVDGFAQIPGSDITGQFDFAGTVWKTDTPGRLTSNELRLEKGGIAVLREATKSQLGEWNKTARSLRIKFNSGLTYHMAMTDDQRFLDGMARRMNQRPLAGSTSGSAGAMAGFENDDEDPEVVFRAPRLYREGDQAYQQKIAERQVVEAQRRNQRIAEFKQQIDQRKVQILAESEEEERAASTRGGTAITYWSLCEGSLQGQLLLMSNSLSQDTNQPMGTLGSDQPRVGELCQSWRGGSRKQWKESILKQGCNGRCTAL